MTIVLTGATGTLGSRILFSLLELHWESLEKIYLPVRSKTASAPDIRIKNMLSSAYAPSFIKTHGKAALQKIAVVPADDLLNPSSFLGKEKVTYFIHSAGFVNLSVAPDAKEEIFQENLAFTKAIFTAFSERVQKFVYISTAFSIGNIGGLLDNDYTNKDLGNYRNHYEASKHASEQFLLKAGKEKNIPIQILRPSVLGGNISDAPNFFISKYMVFYLFAKFFHHCNSKEKIRISTHKETGLNIIPTDYAAKVIAKVLDKDIEQLNIVHSKETNMMQGIAKILEVVGFSNFTFTDEKICANTGFVSKLEEFYYNTIGVHLHPYMTSKPNEWDTTLLESILPMPHYDLEEYLSETVAFAKAAKFRNQTW
ncbi:SDR family oxidoreductase [Spongiimicrobium salis]|uniref:SDR family oxidoreductase n=1 Tax=Spongiimicrobium salis TaxID=1667022 RepID=UPI00374DCB42